MYWRQCEIHHRPLRNKRLVKETYIIFPRTTALPLWPMTINVDSCPYLLHRISIEQGRVVSAGDDDYEMLEPEDHDGKTRELGPIEPQLSALSDIYSDA